MSTPFGLPAIHQAAAVLAPHIVQTPLLNAPRLDSELGFRLFLKAEGLQTTGSFKLRGALNKILSLPEQDRAKGVIAFSAGNHGQAVSAAARLVGCKATIVLPNVAPRVKIDNCRWWGATVVLYDPDTEDRREVSRKIADEQGLTLIHPYDDHDVMAGQGTVGLEIAAQLAARQISPDAIAINCSGGGLAAGLATALRAAHPDITIHLTEISGYEKWARSLRSGRPETNDPVARTIIDGINGPLVGTRPLETMLQLPNVHGLAVNDDEALAGMRAAFTHLGIVLEPAGAASLGALIREREVFKGQNVVVVGTGSNVDPAVFARALV